MCWCFELDLNVDKYTAHDGRLATIYNGLLRDSGEHLLEVGRAQTRDLIDSTDEVSKTGCVPRAEARTGSQPGVAGNPSVPQPGLLPTLTSSSATRPIVYKNGLRNPSGLFPAAASRSLMREMTLANAGLEQLVPDTPETEPSITTS